VIDDPGLLFYKLAGGEDGEVWDAAYVVAGSELLVPVSIDFKNYSLAGQVFRGLCDLGGGGVAGAAPVSPEVDEDGNTRALNDLVEERRIYLERFVERG
jgi:hypothetical protein